MVAPDDAGAQTTFILDKISASLKPLGASLDQVVRTRIYLVDEADTLEVSKAHGRIFGTTKPANTLIVGRLLSVNSSLLRLIPMCIALLEID